MNKSQKNNLRLGILVISGTVLFIVALYFIGSNKNLFGSSFRVKAAFINVNGLQVGNNVRYSGIHVGTVDQIEIKNDTIIMVTMLINESMKKVLKHNTIASLGTDGLMGNKLVNLDPGNEPGEAIVDNTILPSLNTVNTEEMLRTLELTNKNIALVSTSLKNITGSIDLSRGTLYTLLMDTTIAISFKRTMSNIQSVSHELSEITVDISGLTNDIRRNDGLMGTLINDTTLAADLKSAVSTLKNSGDNISSAAATLDVLLQKINTGDGTLNTLVHDSITAKELEQGIIYFNSSMQKLEEDLEAMKHSFLLRGYFRKKEKNKDK